MEGFMREAIRQARKGLGRTSPNPPVGCVIVRGGVIVSRGYHREAGGPHAEVDALRNLHGRARKGDTLYVTLEPCNHHGRTPPCTEAILTSGIRRVVVGARDPNPRVVGGGIRYLEEKGLEVTSGVLEPECLRLIESFRKHSLTGLPFVAAKSALTLDGWTATSTGHSKWITGERARAQVHRMRGMADAVMVGVGTVLADDPSLTVRLKGWGGRNPLRVVVDTHLRIDPSASVLKGCERAPTLIVSGESVSAERRSMLEKPGIATMVCPETNGKVDLAVMLRRLGEMSVTSVLLEGGSTLMGAMIREKRIDKFYLFHAPKILGGGDGIPMASGPGTTKIDQCVRLKHVHSRWFGEDLLIEGYPEYGEE